MNYYPIFLDLRGRPCLVVGGGQIATQKVDGLLSANADVTVISAKITDAIAAQARMKKLRHFKRRYQEGDLKGYFLAYAVTGEPEVDLLMAVEANMEGVLLDVGNRPVLCSFITPAVVQRGDLAIAISTGGKCPGFTRRVKRKIEALINPQYGIALWQLRPSARS
jgi:precorrin-2 dehydrogenase / sirohydrochlorin ferrochelatase